MEQFRHHLSVNGHRSANGSRIYSPAVKPRIVSGKTPRRIRKAVADAIARQNRGDSSNHVVIKVGDDWDGAGHRALLNLPDDLLDQPTLIHTSDSVIQPLPRRRQVDSDDDVVVIEKAGAPAQWKMTARPRVGPLKVWARLMVWLRAILYFQLGNWYDVIRRQDSQERRAIRLRKTFEGIGGTFVKIGQQMASRLDLLPQRYCEELASMLDRYPPFPTADAIAVIERSTGRKLDEIFSAFDPEPIGSASVACVYQAYLRQTGEKVAVKVRRPRISNLFEADFKVLDYLGKLAEALTLVPPGYTFNIRTEFRNTLTSELDFRREGRLGELFRRHANQAKQHYFTAPKVYAEFTSEELVVQEFVSGMWLWEILNTIEHHDAAGFARMRELNIDPKVIAHRLLYAHYWSLYSHISFHADPHPANLVVRANNELVFIDFGASGHLSDLRKKLYRRTLSGFESGDAALMARNALMIAEPLPPMDVNAIARDLEVAYLNHIIAIKSKKSPWYERTSASVFVASIGIMSRHKVPAPQDMLMFARATLLYDTLAARLNPQINFYKEHEIFAKRENKKARKKARKTFLKSLRKGLDGSTYQTIGQLLNTGDQLLFRAQRLMSLPYDFAILPFVVEKWIFTALTVIRLLLRIVLVTALGVGIVAGIRTLNEQPVVFSEILQSVITSPIYIVVIAIVAIMYIRLIMFRLGEKTRME